MTTDYEIAFLWTIANQINRLRPELYAYLEGGGAAITIIGIRLQDDRELLFGNDGERWYGSVINADGEEITDHSEALETDIVGTSKNAELIARGILAAIDTFLAQTAS